MSGRSFLSRTTSVPNSLLDEAMPGLRLCEVKLLLLVIRQTRGWTDGAGKRKTVDWMTHRQIRHKTGCSSTSISRAIDSLVRQRLIEVRDGSSALLTTPAQRQRCSRLYFSLAQPSRATISPTKVDEPVTHHPKANQPKKPFTKNNNVAATNLNQSTLKSRRTPATGVLSGTESKNAALTKNGFQILTTTKATEEHKEQKDISINGSTITTERTVEESLTPLARQVLRAYEDAFEKHFCKVHKHKVHKHKDHERSSLLPSPVDSKGGDTGFPHRTEISHRMVHELERLATTTSQEEVMWLLELFFTVPLPHLQRQGHSLSAFVSSIHILRLLGHSKLLGHSPKTLRHDQGTGTRNQRVVR
jgi:hypothetical protein